MALNAPRIITPKAETNVVTNVLNTSWDFVNQPAYWEIALNDTSDVIVSSWRVIGLVKGSSKAFRWDIPDRLTGKNYRIAIRGVSEKGERSPWAVSPSTFSIIRSNMPAPIIVHPQPGSRLNHYVKVTLSKESSKSIPLGSVIHAFYSSESLKTGQQKITDRVPVENGYFYWDISSLAAAEDYKLTTYFVDRAGTRSSPAEVINLDITTNGYFLIDTKPPEGGLIINNHDVFTKSTEVSLDIAFEDYTTGVHSMRIFEDGSPSSPLPPSNSQTYTMSAGDGVKKLSLEIQDYAGNRNSDDAAGSRMAFWQYLVNNGSQFVDSYEDVNGVYAVLTKSGSSTVYNHRNFIRKFCEVPGVATTICTLQGVVYVMTASEGKCSIHKCSEGNSSKVLDITAEDSEAISSASISSGLWIGSKSGTLYLWDGKSLSEGATLPGAPIKMKSIGGILYAIVDGLNMIFNGTGFRMNGSEVIRD